MKLNTDTLVALLLLSSSTTISAHPQPITDAQLLTRDEAEAARDARRDTGIFADISALWKRKGGGSGGGKGGTTSSGSSSSSSSSSSSGSSSSKSGSSAKGSSSSNTGGSTKTGSGVTKNYGGGKYYGGGATTPYTSGAKSPLGISPVPVAAGVGIGALAYYPGHYYYGAYAYPYYHPYYFHNRTAHRNSTNTTKTRRDLDFPVLRLRQTDDTGANETKPVVCLCGMYAECGCDDSGNTTFLDSLIGDGTYANLNLSLVQVADVNGTSTIVLNGTLPNGTTDSGGTENANGATRVVAQSGGYWVMIALVMATVYML